MSDLLEIHEDRFSRVTAHIIYCTADQRFCFPYTDNTVLLILKISSSWLSSVRVYTVWFVSNQVINPKDQILLDMAQILMMNSEKRAH